ncbi:hypothetical protein F2P56_008715, partial [Juglans regia]
MTRLWNGEGGISFKDFGRNKFLLEFHNPTVRTRVLTGRPWSFDRNLICIQECKGRLALKDIEFSLEPFWLQLHDLPFAAMNKRMGEKLGTSAKTSSDINKEAEAEGTNEVSDDDERVEEPKPGMEFATDKELLAYYKRYAKQQGFGVITQRTKRDASGKPKYVTIGCARGGKYHPSHSNISKPWPTIKTDCKAKLNAHLDKKGVWVLTTAENTHNHGTVSPQKSRFFRSHKCLDEYSKRMLDLNDRAGIRMNKNFGALVVDAGGFENLEFQEKDCRNYINKARHLRLGKGGGEALSDYFKRMRKMNDGFISVIDVDDELRLRNVFWADARSRAAYEYFGDVITFDTTYLTNRYGMPFAPFVGVNHHGQSILLGAGLISSEDTSTFVWLFRAWLDCMNGQAPKAIITDQDRAMKSAIAM